MHLWKYECMSFYIGPATPLTTDLIYFSQQNIVIDVVKGLGITSLLSLSLQCEDNPLYYIHHVGFPLLNLCWRLGYNLVFYCKWHYSLTWRFFNYFKTVSTKWQSACCLHIYVFLFYGWVSNLLILVCLESYLLGNICLLKSLIIEKDAFWYFHCETVCIIWYFIF